MTWFGSSLSGTIAQRGIHISLCGMTWFGSSLSGTIAQRGIHISLCDVTWFGGFPFLKQHPKYETMLNLMHQICRVSTLQRARLIHGQVRPEAGVERCHPSQIRAVAGFTKEIHQMVVKIQNRYVFHQKFQNSAVRG